MATLSRLAIDLVANSASFRKDLDKAGKKANNFSNKARKDFGRVAAAVSALGIAVAGLAGTEMVQASDAMQNLRNRMFALTKSAEQTEIAMKDIAIIARLSRADLASVGDVYTKISMATQGLGFNQEELAKATASVSNTFLLSGASASEAANSARQLAQGLASGKLNGDELRSVMENNAVLSGILADGFNVTRGELRKMGEQGTLTATKIMPILIKAFADTDRDVRTMSVTVGQATTLIRNKFVLMSDEFMRTTGITAKLAGAMTHFAENMQDFARIAVFGAMVPALAALALGIRSVTAAMMTNPIGALMVAATIAFTAAAEVIFQNWQTISDFFVESFTVTLPNAFDQFKIGAIGMRVAIINQFSKLLDQLEPKINSLIDMYNKIPFVDAVSKFTNTIDTTQLTSQIDALEAVIEARKAKFAGRPSLIDIALGTESSGTSGPDFGTAGADAPGTTTSGMSSKKLEEMTLAAETIRGAFESIAAPISNVFTNILTGVTSIGDGLKMVAMTILNKVIGAFVEMGVNWVLQQTMMKAMEAAGIASSVAMSVGAGAAMATAYAPAAAMASLASFGSNAVPAAAGISSTVGLAHGLAMGQAHDGIDNVPNTGTYLLEQGERVVDNRLNGDLKDFLKTNAGGNSTVNNAPQLNFNVQGGDAENVEQMLNTHRGKFESMIRSIYHEGAMASPF